MSDKSKKTSPDPSVITSQRVHAIESILDRKRIGLESAIEVLEAAGYSVLFDPSAKRYRVTPPSDLVEQEEPDEPTEDSLCALQDEFLADYPKMLTVKDVAEITGMHAGSVRRLCNAGKIPFTKFGSRLYIPKTYFTQSNEQRSEEVL